MLRYKIVNTNDILEITSYINNIIYYFLRTKSDIDNGFLYENYSYILSSSINNLNLVSEQDAHILGEHFDALIIAGYVLSERTKPTAKLLADFFFKASENGGFLLKE